MDVLIVVDMQNDFVTGALGSSLAQKIVIPLKEYLNSLKEDTYVILTRDTHDESYMESNEGLHLPIPHCLFNTWGWQIVDELKDFKYNRIINKPNFGIGSGTWRNILKDIDVKSITLVGLCTDICVISNALSLKIAYPEIPVRVIERLCMGVTKKSHEDAIATMKMCQVDII
ncbi:MAG: isochorismatase family cysteine hydrolase [Anaeroplasma sp.]|uniref:cysteine hydrolase family protein n=1 Tax=Anaeroplasma sp. TaxID=1872523 RepID=UPI002A91AAED|nr:isochorismatase family cysteine hydrolase [Anaeroplasma sp.]MDY5983290.1 isochorismatase family cysteine hydrolase [Anaeroplasma sp.]